MPNYCHPCPTVDWEGARSVHGRLLSLQVPAQLVREHDIQCGRTHRPGETSGFRALRGTPDVIPCNPCVCSFYCLHTHAAAPHSPVAPICYPVAIVRERDYWLCVVGVLPVPKVRCRCCIRPSCCLGGPGLGSKLRRPCRGREPGVRLAGRGVRRHTVLLPAPVRCWFRSSDCIR